MLARPFWGEETVSGEQPQQEPPPQVASSPSLELPRGSSESLFPRTAPPPGNCVAGPQRVNDCPATEPSAPSNFIVCRSKFAPGTGQIAPWHLSAGMGRRVPRPAGPLLSAHPQEGQSGPLARTQPGSGEQALSPALAPRSPETPAGRERRGVGGWGEGHSQLGAGSSGACVGTPCPATSLSFPRAPPQGAAMEAQREILSHRTAAPAGGGLGE